MRHIRDGVLRRLDDEPLAVPDRATDHVAHCERCEARRAQIARDTELAAELFATEPLVPDTERAWAQVRRELEQPSDSASNRRGTLAAGAARPSRLPRISARSGLAIGAVGIVLAGTAAAATLTTIFSPTHVAALTLSESDLRAIAAFTGSGDAPALWGFSNRDRSKALPFGTLVWTSSGSHPVTTLAEAAAGAGFPVSLPARVPAGVGSAKRFGFAPAGRIAVRFNSTAGRLAGSSVTLDVGPAVMTRYPAATTTQAPAMVVITMRRPTARSSGASIGQIEAFLLGRPGIPPQLAEQVRLLGDLRTTLPVPVPPNFSVRSVRVAGWPAVLLTDPSNAASGVIWEDGRGLLHLVAGILDQRDVLNVANQLG